MSRRLHESLLAISSEIQLCRSRSCACRHEVGGLALQVPVQMIECSGGSCPHSNDGIMSDTDLESMARRLAFSSLSMNSAKDVAHDWIAKTSRSSAFGRGSWIIVSTLWGIEIGVMRGILKKATGSGCGKVTYLSRNAISMLVSLSSEVVTITHNPNLASRMYSNSKKRQQFPEGTSLRPEPRLMVWLDLEVMIESALSIITTTFDSWFLAFSKIEWSKYPAWFPFDASSMPFTMTDAIPEAAAMAWALRVRPEWQK